MEAKKSFEDIINEAKQIADRRNRVFNELKIHLIKNIIPSFSKLLKGYDIKCTDFTLYNCPFEGYKGYKNFDGDDKKYYIFITGDGEIRGGREEYYIEMTEEVYDPNNLSRKCLIQLCTQIKEKANFFNEKYNNINDKAEELML